MKTNLSTNSDGDVKKFLFDTNDFDSDAHAGRVQTYTEEELAAAQEQSFTQGKTSGQDETQQALDGQISRLLGTISDSIVDIAAKEEQRDIALMTETIQTTLKVVRKVLPDLAQKNALSEIEHVILSSLEARRDEPRIAVTIPTQHLEALKGRIDPIAAERGYMGKIILIADDGLAATDCRVEWADGGAEKLYDNIVAQIEAEFAKALNCIETLRPEATKEKQKEEHATDENKA